ncbi:hypothetical protein EDD34_4106 [Myceligenerans xiligouense]|uniref:Uncharacterized protein n=1 Tax=Myceligenerans xiligouense TaxID=253184 RepID=A0A3N4YQV8_9MICO|nr:hypothetical protein EDD34_4106 [Myceligenerans xiligouense]
MRVQAGWLVDDTDSAQRKALMADLESRKAEHQKRASRDLLNDLSDAGFAWRSIAHLTGVSVPAVRKWRSGAGVSPANHASLAKVVALTEMLETHAGVFDAASWLEYRIKDGVSVTPFDMLLGGRYDLVMLHATNTYVMSPEAILDEFRGDWRSSCVDNAFETYVDAEGVMAIRPKGSR